VHEHVITKAVKENHVTLDLSLSIDKVQLTDYLKKLSFRKACSEKGMKTTCFLFRDAGR